MAASTSSFKFENCACFRATPTSGVETQYIIVNADAGSFPTWESEHWKQMYQSLWSHILVLHSLFFLPSNASWNDTWTTVDPSSTCNPEHKCDKADAEVTGAASAMVATQCGAEATSAVAESVSEPSSPALGEEWESPVRTVPSRLTPLPPSGSPPGAKFGFNHLEVSDDDMDNVSVHSLTPKPHLTAQKTDNRIEDFEEILAEHLSIMHVSEAAHEDPSGPPTGGNGSRNLNGPPTGGNGSRSMSGHKVDVPQEMIFLDVLWGDTAPTVALQDASNDYDQDDWEEFGADFQRLDPNGMGKVRIPDVCDQVTAATGYAMTEFPEIHSMICAADADSDGCLNFTEYVRVWRSPDL